MVSPDIQEDLENLELWFSRNGGYLHPSTHLRHDENLGVHLRADSDLVEGEKFLTVPHSVTLSCLNAMADDEQPAFKKRANDFTVEALGYFYLISQWIDPFMSFWQPYLVTLPSPAEGFGTPFWFDDEDMEWIKGTDVHSSYITRARLWREDWTNGLKILQEEGVDTEPYTWELFRWAATVYSSRCLNSFHLMPYAFEYWPTYKNNQLDKKQVQVRVLPERLHRFGVLFPVWDALNHKSGAPISGHWDRGAKGFGIPTGSTSTITTPILAGSQVLNDYYDKSNAELLLGYGFCEEDNPNDCVLETLKPPPEPVQALLKTAKSHCWYFTQSGIWKPEAATFKIPFTKAEDMTGDPERVWDSIPVRLTELFYYIVRFERGLDVEIIEANGPTSNLSKFFYHGKGLQYLPRIAFYIVSSLVPKMSKIEQATANLPAEPKNRNQRYAKLYRDGQMRIMRTVREGLSAYNRSLRPPPNTPEIWIKSAIWTPEEVQGIVQKAVPSLFNDFQQGLSLNDIQDLVQLRGTDAEQRIWVIWLCYLYQAGAQGRLSESDDTDANRLASLWLAALRSEYGDPHIVDTEQQDGMIESERHQEQDAAPFLSFVRRVAASSEISPSSVWRRGRWTSEFVLDWGLRIARSQGMMMKIAEDDVRYVVYLDVDHDDGS